MASLRQCGGAMRDEADADTEDSETGIRQELKTLPDYAQARGTRVRVLIDW